jgi:hypothetical protein
MRISIALGIACAASAVALSCSKADDGRNGVVSNDIAFYAKVIDQDGTPAADARMVVQLSRLVDNPVMDGKVFDRLPENRKTYVSDSFGNILITVEKPLNVLEVGAIEKPGYVWVQDLSAQVKNAQEGGSNTLYYFHGLNVRYPINEPDKDNPAIYAMQKLGNMGPATRPSRGGTDLLNDNTHRVNHPMPCDIPSAGERAPRTQTELASRLEEYVRIRGDK